MSAGTSPRTLQTVTPTPVVDSLSTPDNQELSRRTEKTRWISEQLPAVQEPSRIIVLGAPDSPRTIQAPTGKPVLAAPATPDNQELSRRTEGSVWISEQYPCR